MSAAIGRVWAALANGEPSRVAVRLWVAALGFATLSASACVFLALEPLP